MDSLEPTPLAPSRPDEPDMDPTWFLSSTPTSPPLSQASREPVTKQERRRLDAAPLDYAFHRRDLHEPAREQDTRAETVIRAQARRSDVNQETGTRNRLGQQEVRTASLSSIDGIDSVTSTPRSSRGESSVTARAVEMAYLQSLQVTNDPQARDDTPPFAFDLPDGDTVNRHVESGQASLQSFLTARPPTPPLGPFSTAAPNRAFRSRYASSSTESLSLGDYDSCECTTAPVAASLGDHTTLDAVANHTSPAPASSSDIARLSPGLSSDTIEEDDGSGRPSLRQVDAAAQSPRWRRSFSYDAQRAEPLVTSSSAVAASTAHPDESGSTSSAQLGSSIGVLRRRPRQSSSSDSASDKSARASALSASDSRSASKRRRSGSLLSSSASQTTAQAGAATRPSRSIFWPQPSVSRIPAGPVLSSDSGTTAAQTTTEDDVRTIRRRTRLSFGCLGTGPGDNDIADRAGLEASRPRLESSDSPRDSLTRQSTLLEAQARRSDALMRRGEGVLREAAGVLRRAEDSMGRASRLVQAEEWEHRLPSVGALPAPGASSTVQRPVVGIRLGEGFSPDQTRSDSPASTNPPRLPLHQRRSSGFSLRSAGISPASPALDAPASPATSSASSGRTRQFLTSLRSRRPQLTRNSTSVSPPERDFPRGPFEHATADMTMDTSSTSSSLRTWTLPSPPLASGLATVPYDEDLELRAAENLNEQLLERRRVAETLATGLPTSATSTAPRPAFWGDTGETFTSRRLRGPTERANERWRRGEPPASLAASSSTTINGRNSPPIVRPAPPSWYRSFPSTPMLAEPSRRLSLGQSDSPPRLRDEVTSAQADAFFLHREDSPSPRRRRQQDRFDSGLFSARSLNAAEEGMAENGPTLLETGPRDSIRLPLTGRPEPRLAPRVRFEEAEEAPPQLPGWTAPATGPLMLSSGSDGRRMVFPHPAHAAGPALAPSQSEHLYGRRFGPDHLLEDDDPHPPPFTFDRLGFREPARNQAVPPAPTQRYPRESGVDDDADVFDPFAEATAGMRRRTTRVTSDYDSLGRSAEERARMPSGQARDSTVAAPTADSPAALLEDRLSQHRLQRFERLQALRQERSLMRSLLSGTPDEAASSSSASRTAVAGDVREHLPTRAASPPRSPGGILRRRGLGDFLRGLGNGGGGGRGGLISIFDDDFPMFWGRDSAALDPRNYLDDDEFDSSYEALIRLSERLGEAKPQGVSASKLATLAKFKYDAWPLPRRLSVSAGGLASTSSAELAQAGIDKEERCGICLCDYVAEDDCMLGNCGHGFHEECLASWLKAKGTCPVCRADHTSPH